MSRQLISHLARKWARAIKILYARLRHISDECERHDFLSAPARHGPDPNPPPRPPGRLEGKNARTDGYMVNEFMPNDFRSNEQFLGRRQLALARQKKKLLLQQELIQSISSFPYMCMQLKP